MEPAGERDGREPNVHQEVNAGNNAYVAGGNLTIKSESKADSKFTMVLAIAVGIFVAVTAVLVPLAILATNKSGGSPPRQASTPHAGILAAGLLTPSDLNTERLAFPGFPLRQSDKLLPGMPKGEPSTCFNGNTYFHDVQERVITDSQWLSFGEIIYDFGTPDAAAGYYPIDKQGLTCGSGFSSTRNISSRIPGQCDAQYAITASQQAEPMYSRVYAGVILCGRYEVIVFLETSEPDDSDTLDAFDSYAAFAANKVRQYLPGARN